MKIDADFTGGNIKVISFENDVALIERDLRETEGDWFYWAFHVSGAAGKTITFDFQGKRHVAYYGPAVSHDLLTWRWLGEQTDNSEFTYTFQKNEDSVFFAHHMLYHPQRFLDFTKEKQITVGELCVTPKKRSVPYIKIGNGNVHIILTARHHACESPGNYVLEGFLDEYLRNPIPDTQIFCVPFVDYDGVVDGDQGKRRSPHDHNRDYHKSYKPIHCTVAEIRNYIDSNKIDYGFDFHAPGSFSGINDIFHIFTQNKDELCSAFIKTLQKKMTEHAECYKKLEIVHYNAGYLLPTFANYINSVSSNTFAAIFEIPYFGENDNIFSEQNAKLLGRCMCLTLKESLC